MSEIKCPVCQNNLHKINIIVSTCTNDKCKLWGSSIPNLVLEAMARTGQNLERTRKKLEQSETCCTEWEKQALDYKAENIALSGELEYTRKVLDVARNGLEYIFGYEGVPKYVVKHIRQVLDQIKNETALEQKDNGDKK